MQKRREDAPRLAQLVGAHEVGLNAREHLRHEPLVRVRQLDVLYEYVADRIANANTNSSLMLLILEFYVHK